MPTDWETFQTTESHPEWKTPEMITGYKKMAVPELIYRVSTQIWQPNHERVEFACVNAREKNNSRARDLPGVMWRKDWHGVKLHTVSGARHWHYRDYLEVGASLLIYRPFPCAALEFWRHLSAFFRLGRRTHPINQLKLQFRAAAGGGKKGSCTKGACICGLATVFCTTWRRSRRMPHIFTGRKYLPRMWQKNNVWLCALAHFCLLARV